MVLANRVSTMNFRDVALGGFVATVWGMNFVVIDEGLSGAPPLLFAAIRFALVGLFAVVIPRPTCSTWFVVSVGLFMSAGQFGLLYAALGSGMPAGLASLVLQAQVPFTIVLAAAVFGEPVSARACAGVVMALIGLGIVAAGRGVSASAAGVALTIAAAVSWAIGNLVSRRAGAGGLSMVVWSSLVVPAPLLIASALAEGLARWSHMTDTWGWTQTWSTAYTVLIATIAGFGLWNHLLARHRAASVVPFALLVPVVGLTSAAVFQHQQPSTATVTGGLILLGGAAIALVPTRPSTSPVHGVTR